MSDDYHNYFRNLANKKISGLSASAWKRVANLTHKLVHTETEKTGWKKPEIRLVPFVQMVSGNIATCGAESDTYRHSHTLLS